MSDLIIKPIRAWLEELPEPAKSLALRNFDVYFERHPEIKILMKCKPEFAAIQAAMLPANLPKNCELILSSALITPALLFVTVNRPSLPACPSESTVV